jgi:hypothetical protein
MEETYVFVTKTSFSLEAKFLCVTYFILSCRESDILPKHERIMRQKMKQMEFQKGLVKERQESSPEELGTFHILHSVS